MTNDNDITKFKIDQMKALSREITLDSITSLAQSIYTENTNKGFWEGGPEKANIPEKIALMHSELSEALEAYRANSNDDKLTEYKGLDVELADTVIRIFDFCGAYNIPIGKLIGLKLDYNKSRPYKHGKVC